ncbi:MAG: hypothetical protein IJS41_03915 [Clostridia bacterium]|nr:hypothetical protein [Clostridia bacterium]
MTNFENLKSMTKEQMAWLLMAYIGGGCRTCVCNEWYKNDAGHLSMRCDKDCMKGNGLTCYDGNLAWLERETEEDEHDKRLIGVTKNNAIIGKLNGMPPGERADAIHWAINHQRTVFEDGYTLDMKWVEEDAEKSGDYDYQPETCYYTGGSCCYPISECKECPNHPRINIFGNDIPV